MKSWIVIAILVIAVVGGVLAYNQYNTRSNKIAVTTTTEQPRTTITSTSPYSQSKSSTMQTSTTSKYLVDVGWNTEYLSCNGACDVFKVLAWKVVYEKTNINPPFYWIAARFIIKVYAKDYGAAELYNPEGKEIYFYSEIRKGENILSTRTKSGWNATIMSGDYKLVLYDYSEKVRAVWTIHVISDKVYIDKAVIKTVDLGENTDVRFIVEELKAVIRNEGNVPSFFCIELTVGGDKYLAFRDSGIIEPGTTKEFTWKYSPSFWISVQKPGVYDGKLSVNMGYATHSYNIKVVVPDHSEHVETYVFKS